MTTPLQLRARELLDTLAHLQALGPVLLAASQGETIEQWLAGSWYRLPPDEAPAFDSAPERYRESPPVPIRYRRYVFSFAKSTPQVLVLSESRDLKPQDLQQTPGFVRWIDHDWVQEA